MEDPQLGMSNARLVKLVIVGPAGVGKTSLRHQVSFVVHRGFARCADFTPFTMSSTYRVDLLSAIAPRSGRTLSPRPYHTTLKSRQRNLGLLWDNRRRRVLSILLPHLLPPKLRHRPRHRLSCQPLRNQQRYRSGILPGRSGFHPSPQHSFVEPML